MRTLPGRYYTDVDIWQLEQERIFSRLWVCVGRSEDISSGGDFRTFRLGSESVLVVRGEDGQARAFLNVCRHRGTRLCPEERGHFDRSSMTCRYHRWSYDLQGKLVHAPHQNRAPSFDPDQFRLAPVRLEEWQGLIWLNADPAAPPLLDQIGPPLAARLGGLERLAPYRLSALRVGHTIDYDVPANWKIVVENFLDAYHVAPTHPELFRVLRAVPFRKSPHDGVELAEHAESMTITGKANNPPFRGLLDGQERHYFGLVVRPNVFLNLLPDQVIIHVLSPMAPDRTRVTCHWLFDVEVMSRPGWDAMPAVELMDLVNRQDWELCALVQEGVRSRAFETGGIFMPFEGALHDLTKFILEQLESHGQTSEEIS